MIPPEKVLRLVTGALEAGTRFATERLLLFLEGAKAQGKDDFTLAELIVLVNTAQLEGVHGITWGKGGPQKIRHDRGTIANMTAYYEGREVGSLERERSAVVARLRRRASVFAMLRSESAAATARALEAEAEAIAAGDHLR